MEYSLLVTDSFKRDVAHAIGYLTDELGSPLAARKLIGAIDGALDSIRSMPEIHAVSTKSRLCNREIRERLVANYVIAYRIDGASVVALRLFHQIQDFEQLI